MRADELSGERSWGGDPEPIAGGGKKSREGAGCQGSSRYLSQVLLTKRENRAQPRGPPPRGLPESLHCQLPKAAVTKHHKLGGSNGGRYTLRVLESEIKVSTGLYLSKAQGPPSRSQLWSLPGDLGIP